MSNDLQWHDEAVVYGIKVQAFFFDPRTAESSDDFVARNLPVFKIARPQLVATEADRKNFTFGDLIGQPDAVLVFGNGMLSLEYKSQGGRNHDRDRWQRQVKLSALLQCIGGAMVVAEAYSKPTAALLRCHNALYHLNPSQELLDFLAANISGARDYWNEPRRANITQLAEYCEPRVRRDFQVVTASDEVRSDEGRRRHEQLLRA